MTRHWLSAAAATALLATLNCGLAAAQVPEPVYQQLKKMGQVVDVSCTAKLYRPMMPANDYDSWWPPRAAAPIASKAKLYPGVTVVRDEKFGPNAKDLVDIFYGDKGPENRPVFIYVPAEWEAITMRAPSPWYLAMLAFTQSTAAAMSRPPSSQASPGWRWTVTTTKPFFTPQRPMLS